MRGNLRLFVLAGALVAVGLAILVSPFASSQPDGLEKVAAEQEFADAAKDHDLADGPLSDYRVDGVGNERVGTAVAGIVGTLLTFGVGLGLFALVRTRRQRGDRRGAVGT
jgi:hypothetical protein